MPASLHPGLPHYASVCGLLSPLPFLGPSPTVSHPLTTANNRYLCLNNMLLPPSLGGCPLGPDLTQLSWVGHSLG